MVITLGGISTWYILFEYGFAYVQQRKNWAGLVIARQSLNWVDYTVQGGWQAGDTVSWCSHITLYQSSHSVSFNHCPHYCCVGLYLLYISISSTILKTESETPHISVIMFVISFNNVDSDRFKYYVFFSRLYENVSRLYVFISRLYENIFFFIISFDPNRLSYEWNCSSETMCKSSHLLLIYIYERCHTSS